MRFIICAVAASALLGACATNNDEMAMDTSASTGAAADVSATTSAPPAQQETAPAPETTAPPADATTSGTDASATARTGERG